LPAGTAVFVGEYGIDLLDGTVLRGRSMRGRSCRRVRYPSTTFACLQGAFLKRYVYGVPQGAIYFGTMLDGEGFEEPTRGTSAFDYRRSARSSRI
jgi:hypothetical protein